MAQPSKKCFEPWTVVIKNHYEPSYSLHHKIEREEYTVLELKKWIETNHMGNPNVNDQNLIHRGALLADKTLLIDLLKKYQSTKALQHDKEKISKDGPMTPSSNSFVSNYGTPRHDSIKLKLSSNAAGAAGAAAAGGAKTPKLESARMKEKNENSGNEQILYIHLSLKGGSNTAMKIGLISSKDKIERKERKERKESKKESKKDRDNESDGNSESESLSMSEYDDEYWNDFYTNFDYYGNYYPQSYYQSHYEPYYYPYNQPYNQAYSQSYYENGSNDSNGLRRKLVRLRNELQRQIDLSNDSNENRENNENKDSGNNENNENNDNNNDNNNNNNEARMENLANINNINVRNIVPGMQVGVGVVNDQRVRILRINVLRFFNFNVAFRLGIFLWLFGQHMESWQFTMLCVVSFCYYLWQVGILKPIFQLMCGNCCRRMVARNNNNNNVRNENNGNNHNNNDNNESSQVLPLSYYQLIQRFFVGLFASLWPEWDHLHAYPIPRIVENNNNNNNNNNDNVDNNGNINE